MTRRWWVLGGAAVLVATVACGVIIARPNHATPVSPDGTVDTAPVRMGSLSGSVSLDGILTYQGQPDGSPFAAVNQAHGTYTGLPAVGDEIACGQPLYRIDDTPVLLLCGNVPAYRDLRAGQAGHDVEQLNANLHDLGYDARAGVTIAPTEDEFSAKTLLALTALQRAVGLPASGALALDQAVVLPGRVRIAKVNGVLGGPAQPGTPVLEATHDTLEVQVNLDASQQDAVKPGERALITLPGNRSVTGKVDRLGTVAQAPSGQGTDAGPAAATVPAYLSLDDPAAAGGLDQAPVQADITTQGVDDVLSVPVTAIVATTGGGYAVEVLGRRDRRRLVAVQLGLSDPTAGRVQVEGHLRPGDRVVVPSL